MSSRAKQVVSTVTGTAQRIGGRAIGQVDVGVVARVFTAGSSDTVQALH